ncbi:MAG: sulfatase-like hydrolase/transferase [Planctomycetaceae bacterium]|nr:sulfatase-like hydrolase/transferase [Planctomycetaceae bacterium]
MLLSFSSLMQLTCGSIQAAKKPNILFLFADDQRADTIRAHGNSQIQTPHIDKIVKQGFSFRNNYCFGSNSGAVCIPSRAMVHSGKIWMHSNSQLIGEVTLGETLRKQGYATFATGKWHNGGAAILRSFEQGKNVFMGGMCDHTKVPVSEIKDGKLINRGTGNQFSSVLFADAAVEFLKDRKPEQPFFAYVAFSAPHDPRNPPEKYREMYYNNRPTLPENFLPQHPFNNGSLVIRDEVLAGWPRQPDVINDQLCEYYGLITQMDDQIGRILEALEQTGEADNTIIVYAADHGLALGSHGLLGKQSVYEHSMKSPLIFSGPGIPQGKQTEAFSYLFDIYPTLCALTGIQGPAGLEGHDLSSIWKGEKDQVRESVFLPYLNIQRSVRDQRWKLIVYPNINHSQLFDLENDPHEKKNLVQNPKYASQLQKMQVLLKDWQRNIGDTQSLSVENPKPMQIDLSKVKRKPDRHQPQWIIKKYFD